jgi:glycerophosphoryl diester phosphodiesterase
MLNEFEIIAHRGSSFLAPENTLAAVKLAWSEGADAVEADFRLTADNQIVCCHDATLKRTAGADISVADRTLRELQAYDLGAWKSPQFMGERIPTLGQLLETVPPGKRFYVEIKCGPEVIPALQVAIEASSLQPNQVVLICLEQAVCRAIKAALPASPVYWVVAFRRDSSVAGEWRPTADEVFYEVETPKKTPIDGLDVMATGPINAAFVERAKAGNMALCCWTVDDPVLANRLIELGIPGITTNRPGWMREQLSAK